MVRSINSLNDVSQVIAITIGASFYPYFTDTPTRINDKVEIPKRRFNVLVSDTVGGTSLHRERISSYGRSVQPQLLDWRFRENTVRYQVAKRICRMHNARAPIAKPEPIKQA